MPGGRDLGEEEEFVHLGVMEEMGKLCFCGLERTECVDEYKIYLAERRI